MALLQPLFRGTVLGLAILLTACSTYTPPVRETAPVEAPPKVVTPPAPVPQAPPATPSVTPSVTPSSSAALQPLLAKAGQATERGDYEQALALLERAQRIDPDSAEVYLGMARAHRARGAAAQATATAERGLLYCTTDAQCNALRAYTH